MFVCLFVYVFVGWFFLGLLCVRVCMRSCVCVFKHVQTDLSHSAPNMLLELYVFSGSNDILDVLDLSWNRLRQKGAIAIAKGIKVNMSFRI